MAKESMNAVDVCALVRELQALVGGYFDKAYQPSREEVLLRLRVPKSVAEDLEGAAEDEFSGKQDLVIHVGRFVTVTRFQRENPTTPPSFAMNLRKNLGGTRIVAVRQHGFDRVIELDFERRDEVLTLVVELFHDGNVILVRNGRIIVPLLHQSWATREVRPGAEYVPPPDRYDPKTAERAEFGERLRASSSDAVRTLATELNMGGQYAEEACARAGVPKNTPVADLSDAQVDALFDALRGILERTQFGDLEPVIVRREPAGDGEEGEKVDVAPFPLAEHERGSLHLERFPTFNEALDRFFSKAVTVEREDPRLKKLNELRGKIERQLAQQRAAVKKFEREDEESKERGDLLYAHFTTVQTFTERLLAAAKAQGWDAVSTKLKEAKKDGHPDAKLVDSLNPHEAKAVLLLEDFEGKARRVPVDLRKSVQENADDYYERSKKMREKLAGAGEAMKVTEEKLEEVTERGVKLVEEMEAEKQKAPPTKRFWFESYRWFFTSDGHLVIGGRDAGSNEKVVKKHLDDDDRYVHASVSGAASCVVKAKDGQVGDAAVDEAAAFAVCMSRAWSQGVGSADAYWVTPSQVSKTPNPGEFVAKGAFIIRGKRNYVNSPMRFAVGEVELEGSRKVMGGPPSAVTSRSKRYLILEPGREEVNKLASRLADLFEVPVEEIQTILPPGGVRVVEAVGVELAEA